MNRGPLVVAEHRNAAWEDGASPSVSVLVATYDRRRFLGELLDHLDALQPPPGGHELVIVDNGSSDGSWDDVVAACDRFDRPCLAVRVGTNRGPAAGRNAGAARARGAVLAVTDDDCLPAPRWLLELTRAFADEAVVVVQGRVVADPDGVGSMGPWDHTKAIVAPTPFFETCNVAYRRARFEEVGGFDEDDPLLHPPNGRAFGEDACLAAALLDGGGEWRFAHGAVVVHRCIRSTYRAWLDGQAMVVGFPGLARRSPFVAAWLRGGVFLDATSATFALATVGVAASLATRRAPLAALALPWLVRRWRATAPGAPLGGRLRHLGHLAVGDAVTGASLWQGSVRHRRLVL